MQKRFFCGIALFVIFAMVIFFSGCKENNNSAAELPKVSLLDNPVIGENDLNNTIDAEITLSAPSKDPVKVICSTQNETAHLGYDFLAITDTTLQINPGETSIKFKITIVNDTLMEFTEQFRLEITDIQNATIFDNSMTISILDSDVKKPTISDEGFDISSTYPGMEILWTDDFEGATLNESDWNYELGNNNGWGNNELEVYTNSLDNVYIDNGKLVIKAIENGGSYTSGRLTTQGKQPFQYGLVEIRAKLPKGQGIWPALWMLGTNISEVNWPKCGEIDIMEFLGHQPNIVYGTGHWDKNGHQYQGSNYALLNAETFSDKFHLFSILWEKDRIVWYVDYQKFYELSSNIVGTEWPFNNSFFIIFNVAVVGNWPGNPDNTTVFPQTMDIDYIRVYKQAL